MSSVNPVCAAQDVNWQHHASIIALEMLVMKKVKLGARCPRRVLETMMSVDRREVRIYLGEKEVDWMLREEDMQTNAAEIQGCLHRVHGKTRPWSWIVALVVVRVDMSIQPAAWVHTLGFGRPPGMQSPVRQVKMYRPPIRNKRQPQQTPAQVLTQHAIV